MLTDRHDQRDFFSKPLRLGTMIGDMVCAGRSSKLVCLSCPMPQSIADQLPDYIPGLGDTASFIIVGASHDADRGRMLGVGCNVLTTFYIGLLQNERAISQDVSS